MKKMLLLLVVVFSLTSCDWYADPVVLGQSEIEVDTQGQYICSVDSKVTYVVDSVLTLKDGVKQFEKPLEGETVTVFSFDAADKVFFYRGNASSSEIKKTYFKGDNGSASINFTIIFILVIILYAWATHNRVKENAYDPVIIADANEDEYDDECDEDLEGI